MLSSDAAGLTVGARYSFVLSSMVFQLWNTDSIKSGVEEQMVRVSTMHYLKLESHRGFDSNRE